MTHNSHTFGKHQRLLNKAAFDFVFSDAKSSFCRYFTVLYRPNLTQLALSEQSNHPDNLTDATPASVPITSRLGLICSRKVSKLAHERNRLKRITRESFRQASAIDGINQSGHTIDIIVLPKASAVKTDNAQLFQTLNKHWLRIEKQVKKSHQSRDKTPVSYGETLR